MTDKKSSYLKYLPALFQEDPFLGRFLVPFEEVLSSFESLLSEVDRYFSPALTSPVPSDSSATYPELLRWLAQWVALVLDEEWDEAKQRRIIGEAVALYRYRGTVQGLKRYLEIYTGIEPEIRECRWPGGMQIGIASMIGGDATGTWSRLPPDGTDIVYLGQQAPTPHQFEHHDYYVVEIPITNRYPEIPSPTDAQIPVGEIQRYYYRADKVARVDVDRTSQSVTITPLVGAPVTHEDATIFRRDAVRHDTYSLSFSEDPEGTGANRFQYEGNTCLVGEVEMPYRFIVDVKVSASEPLRGEAEGADEGVDLRAVKAIVDLEKPAHTQYYLKLTRVPEEHDVASMQITLRSTIGLDTTIGQDPGRKV
jgi:phage tail-like protein